MSTRQRNELTIAYLETQYSLERPDATIWVSPLSRNPELRAFLAARKISHWAIITPWNPRSLTLSQEENDKRLIAFEAAELSETLRLTKGVDYFSSVSRPKQAEIAGETGFFIAGLFPWEALRIGHRWDQNAIVVGRADAEAEILWSDHESQLAFDRGSTEGNPR